MNRAMSRQPAANTTVSKQNIFATGPLSSGMFVSFLLAAVSGPSFLQRVVDGLVNLDPLAQCALGGLLEVDPVPLQPDQQKRQHERTGKQKPVAERLRLDHLPPAGEKPGKRDDGGGEDGDLDRPVNSRLVGARLCHRPLLCRLRNSGRRSLLGLISPPAPVDGAESKE